MRKLVDDLGLRQDQLPGLAFPLTRPVEIFPVNPEWIRTSACQRKFAEGLILFFRQFDVQGLLKGASTDMELVRATVEQMKNWFAEHMRVRASTGITTEYSKNRRIFQNQGKTWLVVYDGIARSVGDLVGMAYIRQLLMNPGQDIHAATLRSGVGGDEESTPALGSAGGMLDPEAFSAYRARISEIDEELVEADAIHDLGRKDSLNEERELLYVEIGRATGLHGKNREASSDRERARQSVSTAIHRALRVIPATQLISAILGCLLGARRLNLNGRPPVN